MKNTIWRLILSLGAGMIVTGLCFDIISRGAGTFYATYPQNSTQRKLENLKKRVETYRKEKGQWPSSIGDLNFQGNDPLHQERQIFDGWHRPIIYERRGSTFRLVSNGADGRVGGVGLNCDLTSAHPLPPEARMSRLDNLRHPLSWGMETIALICGGFVAVMTFQSIKNEDLKREKWLALSIQLVILVVVTALVSIFITMMHVPSGH